MQAYLWRVQRFSIDVEYDEGMEFVKMELTFDHEVYTVRANRWRQGKWNTDERWEGAEVMSWKQALKKHDGCIPTTILYMWFKAFMPQ